MHAWCTAAGQRIGGMGGMAMADGENVLIPTDPRKTGIISMRLGPEKREKKSRVNPALFSRVHSQTKRSPKT